MSQARKISVLTCIIILFCTGLSYSFDSSEKKTMSQVIAQCEDYNISDFASHVDCIKNTYRTEGRFPDASGVRAFYAYLDQTVIDYNNKQITDSEARIYLHNAYDKTVGAQNRDNELNRAIRAPSGPVFIYK